MHTSKILKIQIRVAPQKLSPASSRALEQIERYDWILFTSKHAAEFFIREMRRRNIRFSTKARIAAVGPETADTLLGGGIRVDLVPKRFTVNDMIKSMGQVKKSRILFPRSAIAPSDSVRALRRRGGAVRVVPLYTTSAMPLPPRIKRALVAGSYTRVIFKSPSGVQGLMRQLSGKEKQTVRKIEAECIGPTTARAAGTAGFKKISIKTVL